MSTSAPDATMRALEIWAPAKINLYLGVHTARDARGYHRVDSVMATTSLADVVRIAPAAELSVRMAPEVDVPMEQNTAWRAAVALGEALDRAPAVSIEIEKHIPFRAGLGGPSTDAAAVLWGLCELWGIDPRDERVDAVARSIGADVPFFLYGALALCDGAGDTLRELFEPLAGTRLVLAQPERVGVTAAAAYRAFDEEPPAVPPLEPLVRALRAHDADAAWLHLANNLAPAACSLAPEIADVVAWLHAQEGVKAAQVTGSGACSFAICEDEAAAERIAAQALAHGWWACSATMEKSSLVTSIL